MTARKERWMLIGTFVLAVLVTFCFAVPNYKTATTNVEEARRLEDRINKLERRQVEVQNLREEYDALDRDSYDDCSIERKEELDERLAALEGGES